MRKIILLAVIIVSIGCNNSKRSAKAATTEVKLPESQDELTQSMERGTLVYEDFCMQCHMPEGTGVQGSFPPLAESNWLRDKRTESIYAVKYGQSGEIVVNGETYNSIMVPMGLSDEEIADVMNYIMNSWGNSVKKMVTIEEVSAISK